MLSICIPTYNRLSYLKPCLKSIFSTSEKYPFEVVIADGGSTDGTLEYLHNLEYDNLKIIEQGKLVGAVKACNACFKKAEGDYALVGNDDITVIPEIMSKACKLMDNDGQIGLVGPKDQELKHGNLPGVTLKLRQSWALLCKFSIVRMEILKKIGYFDERFRTYYIDDDICLSVLSLGHSIIYTKETGLIHYRVKDEKTNIAKEESCNKEKNLRDLAYLEKKWAPLKKDVEEYLEDFRWKKQKALYFAMLCDKTYHSKFLQFFMPKYIYDLMLEQAVVFKDKKYDRLKDFFLAQKYPDEIVSSSSI